MGDSPFRGQQGRLHFPWHRHGCWKGRPSGCCLICYFRLVWAVIRP